MVREIKRNTWAGFCKKFSSANQYRRIFIRASDYAGHDDSTVGEVSLFGITLEKKGRLIDGIQLLSAWEDPEVAARPLMSIKQPTKMLLEKDDQGNDNRLTVMSRDGKQTVIEMTGERNPERERQMVARVAYGLYERRGRSHGSDMNDWLEAEQKVREAERVFV